MDAINIGPLTLPLRVLAAVAAVFAAHLAVFWWRRRRGVDADPALWRILLWGFLAARATGVEAYPTTLFYDSQGKLAARHMGELSPAQLHERLDALR